ncbi:hypothetical protein RHMOL_Rhmol12G0118000 [Rhododendron molle]|uniref:Uncharacterized protein n=1 Tax=Rhododendron molle TaxID=49168 RepID=A0ACC0LGW2_RHOML|nr:hypothetical protein RHMOL_Rhmol12G0118000 [Rhododendron molle]
MGKTVTTLAITIEAWALRIACNIAMELDIFEEIFESDCLELIKLLQGSQVF